MTADELFEMPKLTDLQGQTLVSILAGEIWFYHGTVLRNLLAKGLVEHAPGTKVTLTDYGRLVAERVREKTIQLEGARLAREVSDLLRQTASNLHQPPQVRPDYRPVPVQPENVASWTAGEARQQEYNLTMNWLTDPARLALTKQLLRCGHVHSCTSCAQREQMSLGLERALSILAAELNLIKQKEGYRAEDLRRARLLAKNLAQAIMSSLGIEEKQSNEG